jgi:hypothetical protein
VRLTLQFLIVFFSNGRGDILSFFDELVLLVLFMEHEVLPLRDILGLFELHEVCHTAIQDVDRSLSMVFWR